MKRIITLLLAATMVLGAASLASAVEFKASGALHVMLGLQDNGVDVAGASAGGFDKDAAEDNFYGGQRIRAKLTAKAEGATMVFEAQQQQFIWGTSANSTSNQNADIRLRNGYINYTIPSTVVNLQMGFQHMALPSAFGHPVLDVRVGGVVANIPVTDQIAVTALYARPETNKIAGHKGSQNSVDMYGLIVPMDFGMAKVSPYVVYATIGAKSTAGFRDGEGTVLDPYTYPLSRNVQYMLGGVNVELAPMEAVSVKFDAMMSSVSTKRMNDWDVNGESASREADDIGTGFMVDFAVDYEMPFGTPGVFGWYASGADKNGKDYFWTPEYTDGFGATTLGTAGCASWGYDSYITGNSMGTMGAGLQVADMSFVEGLKHTARVAYIAGTNHKDSDMDLISKTSFIEIDLDSTWAIYQNLDAVVELGYIIPDIDKADGLNTTPKANGKAPNDSAAKAQVTFRFTF